MEEEFQKYTLEDFLDNPDFCSWARSERPELDDFYRQLLIKYPEQKNVFQRAFKLIRLFDDEKLKTDPARKLQIWKEINKIYREQNKPTRYYKLVFRYAAAIALLFTIASLTWYFISSTAENGFISSYNRQDFTETKLLLDNGKEINIQTDRSEIVYNQNAGEITVNNELVQKCEGTSTSVMNQLIVPFGKQSKIVLSDYTEVWLNAGSRLVYPAVFEGDKRKVQLQGEAFFKVSKDKSKPFIVETNNLNIKVLGTSFNVKAYPDEKIEETVLVDGSVSLNLGKTILGKDILLKPEQRLIVTGTDNSYTISKVDVQDYTSWVEGLFVFHDEPLPSVLMRISRFYNLEIKWMNDAETRKISGKLDLKNDYQRVLNALVLISDGNYAEKNGIVYFKLNVRK
ncbi:MAG: hypothetical protein A2W90_06930 [Bacteroidetes bacterium GWF2_42_66]|nr:MAG: hypothetical protein A2W92_01730 [Bacteroidetes bacterium GWA2_42_15]OFY02881.1 MAG: hypothetical protein A2W89_24335 [Bacteroidetes bacterium GWE2_42_39]OFY44536.1 MAG: hypothetical protein A2W90_06930 [Bacteroidetes bacterium GWF2_42_66]HBL74911.1 hypothetical protein [Prolixibacteraceae bacterium]HCR88958.1 hypothetical protein [Prolixibacteraceae bacterium]